ncbi:TonB-dependent receptor [Alteromonadaceae bacterium Bs31]|nr:TonB-dependent receptor [Alteromonadaceae bacterium Bs31]
MVDFTKYQKRFSRNSLAVAVMSVCAGMPLAALAQDNADLIEEELYVTGFRTSLKVALDQKRETTGQVDAVVAEDMADFPDLNLAESLQRIPGVAITRTNGEGQQITVRGLSGRYTMVRINGMETRAGDGNNNGRAFDFNMFASELFNNLVVRKTASASISEGSLGAVVDLNTGRPFNYDEGSTFLVRGAASHNSNSGDIFPRITGLYAYNDPEGKWGASASLAYSETGIHVLTGNSVRWQKSVFNSVEGVECNPDRAAETDPGCAAVSNGFHPRIPRYGANVLEQERLGITGALQWAPTDSTELTFDAMVAQLDRKNTFKTAEVLFRGNEGGMDVTSFDIEGNPDKYGRGNDSITGMEVDNAWVRSEAYDQKVESDFQQFTLTLEQDITDTLRLNGLVGTSSNKGHMPHVTTLMYDDRDYNGYVYDYNGDSDSFPRLAFNGPDISDGTIFTLTEIRDQVHTTESGFDSASLDLEWDINDSLILSGGLHYKKFTLDTKQDRRDGSVCGLGLYDCDTNDDGEDDLLGAPGTAELSTRFRYEGEVGAGSDTVWAAPSLKGWTEALGVYDIPLREDQGRYRDIDEDSLGAFIQLTGNHDLSGNMRFLYDVGVRYVETEQSSSGYNSGVWVTVDRPKYDDTLPSINTALWLNDDLVLRASWAEVMSRPGLSELSPGGTVDSFNYIINFQNPYLLSTEATNIDASVEWYFAEDGLMSFAYFSKDVGTFSLRDTRTGTFASTGLPESVIAPTSPASQELEGTCGEPEGCWEISELTNGEGATIDGFELAVQFPFDVFSDNLPVVIDGMGLLANYTYVDSEFGYDNFPGVDNINARLPGLSKDQYNFTVYYENDVFGARISAAYRSEYYENANPNRSGNLWEIREPYLQYDFSSSYRLNDNWSFNFEVVNLLDEPFEKIVDEEAVRRLESATTGRNILLSASYKF